MLTKEQLNDFNWIMSKMGITWVQEINHPENGFNGYLLRCKAERNEDCTKSILLFEPNDKKEAAKTHRSLPSDKDERIKIRKDWRQKCLGEKFVGVSFDVSEHMSHSEFDKLEQIFPKDGDMLDEIINQILIYTTKKLPSYTPFAMVLHCGQLRRNHDGYLCERPTHIHFLLRQIKKRRTSDETKLIEPSTY